MKTSTATLTVLAVLSFTFSLSALLIVAYNNGAFHPPATPPATPTQLSQSPRPTSHATYLAVTYNEISKYALDSDTTQLTLNVTITYQDGASLTLNYTDFKLGLYRATFYGGYIDMGFSRSLNSDTLNIGPQNPTVQTTLAFKYPTTIHYDKYDYPTQYQLTYQGTAAIKWTNRNIQQ